MDGPAHWRAAEYHLAKADAIETDGDQDSTSAWHQRQAHVHAILASTAAVIATGAHRIAPPGRRDWLTATGPEPAPLPAGGTA